MALENDASDSDGLELLTPIQRRVITSAVEIIEESEPDQIAFLHTVLAQCGMPYRAMTGQRDYVRENGKMSLVLTAGHLLDRQTHKPVLQPLPHGPKPRLIMIHLCSEAVRRQSRVIPVGDSMSAFMGNLGLSVTGGVRGTITAFKKQLNALSASRIQMFFEHGGGASMVNPAPLIQQMDLWFPIDPRQRVLWPSEVTLSEEFYNSLTQYALPLDPRALQALQHSARALDVYTWLAHRLPRVREKKGAFVSWQALQIQFGPDVADIRNFRKQMIKALEQVILIYRGCRVEAVRGGLRLHHSPPPIRSTTIAVRRLPSP
ncbi:replication protein RepA [Rhodospirillum sp. A1_3_36]|uniref:replication protein RepA n=1 Tax=Rhodospirillum sp. A1_3_36 TaxID=3391666 RepID=UPI0039A760E6